MHTAIKCFILKVYYFKVFYFKGNLFWRNCVLKAICFEGILFWRQSVLKVFCYESNLFWMYSVLKIFFFEGIAYLRYSNFTSVWGFTALESMYVKINCMTGPITLRLLVHVRILSPYRLLRFMIILHKVRNNGKSPWGRWNKVQLTNVVLLVKWKCFTFFATPTVVCRQLVAKWIYTLQFSTSFQHWIAAR